MNTLAHCLLRSDQLHKAIAEHLEGMAFEETTKRDAALGMCYIAYEHGASLRLLIANRLPTSAIPLLRLQFEALVRATWIWHAESDDVISKLSVPLTPKSQQAAKKMPTIKHMLDDLETKGPPGASRVLKRFQERMAPALNSFVHSGIHALRRKSDGYPLVLLVELMKNSNAVLLLTFLVTCELGSDVETASQLPILNSNFQDCLPSLEPFFDT